MIHPDNEQLLINAYLALMARHSFANVSMAMVAQEASMTLAQVRATFASEEALLEGFACWADAAMLERYAEAPPAGGPKDRLIAALIARLHVLKPYKAALRSILEGAAADPATLTFFGRVSLEEHKWSLIAAGLNPRGAKGRNLAEAVSFAFVAVIPVWLEEADAALPSTREALARALLHDDDALAAYEIV